MTLEQQDNAQANPPGLSTCLSLYFDQYPEVLQDQAAATHLVFDTLSQPPCAPGTTVTPTPPLWALARCLVPFPPR